MDPLVDLNRAARLAGVTRQQIKRQIAHGVLASSEGKVRLSDLQVLYPEVKPSGSSMVEIVSQIREDAVSKGLRMQREGQEAESLVEEVKRLRTERAYYRERSDQYAGILRDLTGMLDNLMERLDARQKPFLEAVTKWLAKKRDMGP